MPKAPPSVPARRLVDERKQPWPISLVLLVLLAALSYVSAVVLYVIAYRLVQMPPPGSFIDDGVRAAMMYVLLIVIIGVCLLPMFNREWDPALRRYGLMTSIFIVLFVAGRSLGIIDLDPMGSLQIVIDQIVHPISSRLKASS